MKRIVLTEINRIAADSDVPGCWPCTLLRVSVRLQWWVFALGWLAGVGSGATFVAFAWMWMR